MTIRKKQNKLDQRTKIIMIIVLIFVVILAFSYINLRQKSKKIAKEQQQEGHQYGLEEEFEPQEGENRIDDARREDDDADIHQIVYHENRRQQQAEHRLGRRRRAFA